MPKDKQTEVDNAGARVCADQVETCPALTSASTPARIATGRLDHAATTTAKSESLESAPHFAPLSLAPPVISV